MPSVQLRGFDMKIWYSLLLFLLFGCAHSVHSELSMDEAVSAAALFSHIDRDKYEVIARREKGEWTVIFYGKSGYIGDEYSFFVSDDGTVRRVK